MASSAFREESFDETRRPVTGGPSSHGARQDVDTPTPAAATRLDDASSVDHVQEKTPPVAPLKKRQKFKRHCGRFKWWYLAGLIIFLAIILPVFFLVILPAIVQKIVDDQSLPIKGGAFVVLSPEQMMVSLETSLDTPLPAKIDPLTLFLYNKETPEFSPFLNLTLPEQHVDGDTPIVVTNQTVTITNKTELTTWFNNVFDQPKVELSCRGDGVVRLGALKADTHLEKTVEVSSLNQLNGFAIQELRLLVPPEANGDNIRGSLNLPNWGALTLGLGNLTLNLLSGDILLGFLTVYDVQLPPGNNTRNFAGQLFLDALVPNFGTILENQAEALAEGMIRIDVTGKETMVNGQHIDFVEAILNDKRIVSKVPVVKLLADVLNSFTDGGDMSSLFDLVGNTFGNATLLAQALDHWGTNGTVAAATKRAPSPPRRVGPSALTVFKLGMKMMAWKR